MRKAFILGGGSLAAATLAMIAETGVAPGVAVVQPEPNAPQPKRRRMEPSPERITVKGRSYKVPRTDADIERMRLAEIRRQNKIDKQSKGFVR